MKELLDECAAEDSNDLPYEQSWLFRYYNMMALEEKEKSKNLDKSFSSDLNRAIHSNSKSEGKKTKSNSKKAQKALIPLSGSIDIKDITQLQPDDFQPGGCLGVHSLTTTTSAKKTWYSSSACGDLTIDMKALQVHMNIKKPDFM